jgi:hypothetical protein
MVEADEDLGVLVNQHNVLLARLVCAWVAAVLARDPEARAMNVERVRHPAGSAAAPAGERVRGGLAVDHA